MTTVESKMKDVLIEHSTIVNEANSDEGVWSESYITISEKCAAITQEVAIQFMTWADTTDAEELQIIGYHIDSLYQHFITHIYKPTT